MTDPLAKFFRPDGSPIGITFVPARTNRVQVIKVGGAANTMLSLSGTAEDFHTQYARAVDRRLEELGRFDDDELRQRLLAAKDNFLRRYCLAVKPVTVYRIVQEEQA
jgi:hypothetical protein